MSKVSVIMPAYNADSFIEESILSVINQTYTNWSLIIVNDGSTDNTKEVILKYVEKYPDKITLIDKPQNEGTASGLNTLIEAADGEYICWLSADDLFTEKMIEESVVFLEENMMYDWVFASYERIDEQSNFLGKKAYSQVIEEIKIGSKCQPYLFLMTMGCCIYGCAVMLRSKCVKSGNKLNKKYRYAHDYDLWIRIAAQYDVGYIDKVHVKKREYDTQISKQGHNEIDAIHVLFDFIESDLFQSIYQKAGFEDENSAIVAIIIGHLKRFKNRKKEYDELLNILLFSPNEKIAAFWSKEENKWLYNILKRFEKEEWDLRETFFADDTEDSYLQILCDFLDLDGVLFNKQAIRFDRYEGNTIERFNKGLIKNNDIVIGTVDKQHLINYISSEESEYRYLVIPNEKERIKIAISSYMYLKTDILSQLEMEEIQVTDKNIWWELVKGINRI